MRALMLTLALLGLALVLLAAACAANEASAMGGGDADGDSDSDGDTDTDTGGVPIEYPEAINHFMNPNGLMTGPISPPPEDVLGDDVEREDDLDAGEPDEELDEEADGYFEE